MYFYFDSLYKVNFGLRCDPVISEGYLESENDVFISEQILDGMTHYTLNFHLTKVIIKMNF